WGYVSRLLVNEQLITAKGLETLQAYFRLKNVLSKSITKLERFFHGRRSALEIVSSLRVMGRYLDAMSIHPHPMRVVLDTSCIPTPPLYSGIVFQAVLDIPVVSASPSPASQTSPRQPSAPAGTTSAP